VFLWKMVPHNVVWI